MNTLPAGTYYIGDPCYMFPHDDNVTLNGVNWPMACDMIPYTRPECFFGELVPGTGHCFIGMTAYGDGEYPVIEDGIVNGSVGVDAGLIGIFPEALYKLALEVDGGQKDYLPEAYYKIVFEEDFNVHYEDGNFFFGTDFEFEVITDGSFEEAEENEEDEEE